MKTPLERIRLGALFLVAIVLVAVVGYRLLGYDWIGALWMVVVTVSSVGYAEESTRGPWFQLFTIGVIVVGMSAAVYTIGGFIQMVTEGELEKVLGRRRVTKEIQRLQDHVIICGFGRVGQILAEDMRRQTRPFVVIDKDPEQIEAAVAAGVLCLHGDATEDDVLIEAGIERARTLVTGLPNDAANVFITLTARNLNERLQIIARAEYETTEKKLRQAGANKIVLPAAISARHMVRMITHPSTADLMDLVAESAYLEYELDEIDVPEGNDLVGVSVLETEARRRHGLLVVAVRKLDGSMLLNPDPDYRFDIGDIIIIMGRHDDIGRFRVQYSV